MPPVATNIDQLLSHYELVLLDAYGVLLDKQGPLPGAAALIARLNGEQRPYFILTNSASLLPEGLAAELNAMGLAVPAESILTSGRLLAHHFATHRLVGKPCLVLGLEHAAEYVHRAGGVVVEWQEEAEVVVLADQAGFPLLEGINAVLNRILHRLDHGKPVELLLCNPDLIYPVAHDQFGITAGALASLLEAILDERYPGTAHRFHALGKPHAPLFKAAIGAYPDKRALMIGDQLATDILGANRCCIASALVMSGVARQVSSPQAIPDYLLTSLE